MAVTPSQKTSLNKFFKNLNAVLTEAITPKEVLPTAEYAISLIVKRTRLGYGVNVQFGSKQKLKKLSDGYIKRRARAKNLFELTSPKTSNLTMTGQMLESMRVLDRVNGKVSIGPTGARGNKQPSNAKVAAYQEKQGRIFNRVSQLEYQQVLRFYRRSFGDLLRRKRLLQ